MTVEDDIVVGCKMARNIDRLEDTGMNNKRALWQTPKGMTLIEIMIVLAILGGLIAVLVTTVMGRFKAAKIREAKIQISEVSKALDMFYTDCNFYPKSLQSLVTADSDCANWGPDPYLKKMPKDPWGSTLVYELDNGSYVLKSLGADRREGGSGAAADISSDNM